MSAVVERSRNHLFRCGDAVSTSLNHLFRCGDAVLAPLNHRIYQVSVVSRPHSTKVLSVFVFVRISQSNCEILLYLYPCLFAKIEANGSIIRSSSMKVHSDPCLQNLFRGWQGAAPSGAGVIFLGLDANWPDPLINLGNRIIDIYEYLEDGAAWWHRTGLHHPLADMKDVPGYSYHRNFRKLEIPKEMAEEISFVELYGYATTGNHNEGPVKIETVADCSDEPQEIPGANVLNNCCHHRNLERWLCRDDVLVCLPYGQVANLAKLVPCMAEKLPAPGEVLRNELWRRKNICVHTHLSASSGISDKHINEISALIHSWITWRINKKIESTLQEFSASGR